MYEQLRRIKNKLNIKTMSLKKEYKEEIDFLVSNPEKSLPEILREFAKNYHNEQLLIHSVVSSSVKSELIILDGNDDRFYKVTKEELEDWKKDGSLEKGDALYKIELIKQYQLLLTTDECMISCEVRG